MLTRESIQDCFGEHYRLLTSRDISAPGDMEPIHFHSELHAMRFIHNLRVDTRFWRRIYHAASLTPKPLHDKELERCVSTLLARERGIYVYKIQETSHKKLNLSDKGIDLLKSIEQLETRPYDDQTGKQISSWVEGATIGYGHLISSNEWNKYKGGITESQALILFKVDLKPFVDTVRSKLTADIKQHEFDALVLLAFNIGQKAFSDSSVLKLVNNPNAVTSYFGLEDAWKAWNKSQGRVNNGLINRRNAEWNVYSKGVYKKW